MEGQAREAVGREGAMSAPPRDVPFRESGSTPSSRTFDGSSSRTFDGSSSRTFEAAPSAQPPQQHPEPQRQDVWAGAIARLQTQVSYNTSMLESNRRQMVDVENTIRRLDRDMGMFVDGMNQLRDEFRNRPPSAQQPRHDPGDVDILSRQMQTLAEKVSEVDGLKMQIDVVKNRIRHVEEQGSPAAMASRAAIPMPREPSLGEPQPASHPPARPLSRPLQHPLPPMRTSLMGSPAESRSSLLQQPAQPMPVLQSQHPGPSYQQAPVPRHMSSEPLSGPASSASSYRPSEPLPPPSAISAWRPAASSQQPSSLPPPPPPSGPVQPRPVQPDAPGANWASVNAHAATKRSFDEPRQSPYESFSTGGGGGGGSPKRPRLAPIMPRAAYHDDSSYVPSQSTADSSSYNPAARSNRSESSASQTQSSMLPTPASVVEGPARRFITTTTAAAPSDSQESWRPEGERLSYIQQYQPGVRARGRGSRGGGRGRRGARAAGDQQQQELGIPEWEKPGWTGSQVSPNGYYHPLHPFSPRQERGELVRRGGGSMVAGGGGAHSEHEQQQQQQQLNPTTPIVPPGPHDPFANVTVGEGGGGQHGSAGKKSRTKPIRNAEGILIRKDGRPDMRSVSSANNLRKVHAKKEAERAEMEGRTPTSARSIAPAGEGSLSEEGGEEERSASGSGSGEGEEGEGREHATTQERHQVFMSRVFPQGAEEEVREEGVSAAAAAMEGPVDAVKMEQVEVGPAPADSQMTDVNLRAMSEAQAQGHAAGEQSERSGMDVDAKMPTVGEAGEEQGEEEGESKSNA